MALSIPILLLTLLVAAGPLASLEPDAGNAAGPLTEMVSIGTDGSANKSPASAPSISADGRFVAYESKSSNLVPGDNNKKSDIFVYDRQTGQTTLVSRSSTGELGNQHSTEPDISDDGRFVVFTSKASNFIESASSRKRGDGTHDRGPGLSIYLHDRDTGMTRIVSVASDGTPGSGRSWLPSISGNGRFVLWTSHANNLVPGDVNRIKRDPFIHDTMTGVTQFVDLSSQGKHVWSGGSYGAASYDGRYVSFQSKANDLVPNDNNRDFDVFVRDMVLGVTTRVSIGTDGTEGDFIAEKSDISNDGRFVVFQTKSVLVPEDTNGKIDIYVRDMWLNTTSLISLSSTGEQGDQDSTKPRMTGDGRFIAFLSKASNLVSDDNNGKQDLFVHDRHTGETVRASLTAEGGESSGMTTHHSLAADGQFVVFASNAKDLVDQRPGRRSSVYVHELRDFLYFISGTVIDSHGAPLAGVTISTGPSQTTTTDSAGNYTLDGLSAGTYLVTASKQHYEFAPVTIPVKVPLDKYDVDFVGTELFYDVSGRVTTQAGDPIAGVTVSDGQGQSDQTDANGVYTLIDLRAGAYTLSFSKPHYVFDPATLAVSVQGDTTGQDTVGTELLYTVSGTIRTAVGTPIAGVNVSNGVGQSATTDGNGDYTLVDVRAGSYTLTPSKVHYVFTPVTLPVTVGGDTTGQDFLGRELLYTVSGQVLTATGTPLAGVTVSDGATHSAVTDVSGQYTLTDVRAGSYTLTASKVHYTFAPVALPVEVGGNTVGQDFVGTEILYTVSGTVALADGTPVPGVTVSDGATHSAVTDGSGQYTLSDVRAGSYTLTASMAGYIFTPTSLPVTVSGNAVGQDFVAEVLYTVSGTVALADGTPIPGVTIGDGATLSAVTDGSGQYTLSDVRAGSYTLTASKAHYTFAPPTLPVTVSGNVAGQDFVGSETLYTIAGTVALADGTPIPGVTVSAGGSLSAVTDGSGQYTLNGVRAGSYTLTASKAHYIFAPPTLPVTVSGSLSGQDFVGTQLLYTVTGNVALADGTPIAGVTISTGAGHVTTTDGAGDYTLTGLVAGDFTVTAVLAGYQFTPATSPVTVPTGGVTVDFVGEAIPPGP